MLGIAAGTSELRIGNRAKLVSLAYKIHPKPSTASIIRDELLNLIMLKYEDSRYTF